VLYLLAFVIGILLHDILRSLLGKLACCHLFFFLHHGHLILDLLDSELNLLDINSRMLKELIDLLLAGNTMILECDTSLEGELPLPAIKRLSGMRYSNSP